MRLSLALRARWRRVRVGLLAALLISVAVPAATPGDVEYQIKASYIYNFLQFVRFPPPLPDDLHVCIVGVDRFGRALDAIDGASTPHGRIKIERLGPLTRGAILKRCHVLYLLDSEREAVADLLRRVDTTQVLTIGESANFLASGGLIELFEKNEVIRFRVNPELAGKTGFRLDAQLIQLGVDR